MNKSYTDLMGALSPEGQAALRDAQRTWLAFRDKQFELNDQFYMNEKQGTMYHVMATNANMELVKKRALELQEMLVAQKEQ